MDELPCSSPVPHRKLSKQEGGSAIPSQKPRKRNAPLATLYKYALDALTFVYISAILPCMSWKVPIGTPNCLRSWT